MGDEPRPMPQITVRDPNRPGQPVDVLIAGDERPPLDPGIRRRRLRIAAVVMALGGLVAGGVEVRDRRAAAAEERRLGAIVDLVAFPDASSSAGFDHASRTVHIEHLQNIRNEGPRPVVVIAASGQGFRLDSGEVRIGPQQSAQLVLKKSVPCAEAEPISRPVRAMTLDVRTAAGVRQVELALPYELLSDEVQRPCGLLPLGRSVETFLVGTALVDDHLRISVDVIVTSPRDVELVAISAGPGLRAELRHSDGTPATLPAQLAVGDADGFAATLHEVRLRVTDCGLARAGAAADPALRIEVRDAREAVPVFAGLDGATLAELVDAVCHG